MFQVQYHLPGRQDLSALPGRAYFMTTSALCAAKKVKQVLPGKIKDPAGADFLLLLQVRGVQDASGSSGPEPYIKRRCQDVQVFGIGDIYQETQDNSIMQPPGDPVADSNTAGVAPVLLIRPARAVPPEARMSLFPLSHIPALQLQNSAASKGTPRPRIIPASREGSSLEGRRI